MEDAIDLARTLWKKGCLGVALSLLLVVVTGVGLACLIWLFGFGGWQKAVELFKPPAIAMLGIPSGSRDNFFANETVRFTLVGRETNDVLWIVDSKCAGRGLEVDHVFGFEKKSPKSIGMGHTVTAVFRSASGYGAVTAFCRTNNVRVTAAVNMTPMGAELNVPMELGPTWELKSIDLARYQGGLLKTTTQFTISEATKSNGPWELVIPAAEIQKASPGSAAEGGRDIWLKYEFVKKEGGKELTLAQPLANFTRRGKDAVN